MTIPLEAGVPVVSVADGLPRPVWRGRIHLGGFLASLPAVPLLVALAETTAAIVATVVYGISMIALFGVSASYHLLARSEGVQRIMRRLDHAMIFVKIAGTYTPVCLVGLPPDWGWPILVVIWVGAAAGVTFKLVAGFRYMRISNVLYLVHGWVAVAALPVIVAHLTGWELTLLIVGGALYTVGAILFALKRPRLSPTVFSYHEVWHVFTVLAAMAHLGMIWMLTS